MIAPARWAAYRAFAAVMRSDADLPTALHRARRTLEDERDRALVTAIVTGTLRWLAAIDFQIARVARRPLDRLDPEVRDILRISGFQLLFLERVPAPAVVNDAVQMIRRVRKRSAAGFANAVLRGLGRAGGALPGEPAADAGRDALLEYLSVSLSHPRWLASRWLDRYGPHAALAWTRFDNAPAPLTLRVNVLKTTPAALAEDLRAHGVETQPARYAPYGLVVVSGNPLETRLAGHGLFVIQDEASQLVASLAGVRSNERVLDACASPGGKTTALAAAMQDRGLVVANDVRPARMRLLEETVASSGASCIRLTQADLRVSAPFVDAFDCVLVDAPCSGLGTVRRDPDIKWKRQESDLAPLARDALAMLTHAARAVRPGGRLVYATCSSEPEENDEVVAQFLAGHPAFVPIDPRRAYERVPAGLAAVLDPDGRLRTMPHAHGLEAFFGAVLRRVSS